MNSTNQKTPILIFILFSIFISFTNNLNAQDLNPNDWPNLVGYWKFQDTSYLTKATVGNDLILVGNQKAVQGAAYGDTAVEIDTGSYYKCYHGIQPNGGGDSVNQYTLMFDFKVLSLNNWHSFFQTDTTNDNDGDCFIKHWGDSIAGSIGVGFTGYSSDSIVPNVWYRLVISVNLGVSYNYYLNGSLLHIGDTDDIAVDDRFALTPAVLFFADNNQEDDTIDVASIAIFDTCLTPTQIATLGTIEPCIANPPAVDILIDSASNNFTYVDTIVVYGNNAPDTVWLDAGSGFKSYLWSTGDTTRYATIIGQPYTSDSIWVQVTDMNDCIANDFIPILWWVDDAIKEHKSISFYVYPNPATQELYIKFSKPFVSNEVLRFYNSVGQEVKSVPVLKNTSILKVNVRNLKNGIYFYEIANGRGKIIIKE